MGLISGMAVHPKNKAEAFLLFSYKGDPKILRTYNYGQTWSDISGFGLNEQSSNGFPDVIVHDLLVIPDDTATIWAATEIGIVESTDDGRNWHLYNSNLPQVSVFQLIYQDGQFVAATHGRGIWTANLWPVGIDDEETESGKSFRIYPNPATDYIDIEFLPESSGVADITIVNLNGQITARKQLQARASDKVIERISTGSLEPGVYIVEVRLNGKLLTSRFIKR
jgi:hypothetical protein